MAKRRKRRRRFTGVDTASQIAAGLRQDAKDFRAMLRKGDCRHAFLAITSAAGQAGALSQHLADDARRGVAKRRGAGSGKVVFKLEDRFMRKCLLPR